MRSVVDEFFEGWNGDQLAGAVFRRVCPENIEMQWWDYRYILWRRWQLIGQPYTWPLVVSMLNPSVAGARFDEPDQTVTRLVNYATALGASGLIVVNLYAWVATDPKELWTTGHDIVGPENMAAVEAAYQCALDGAGYVVAAWGGTHVPGRTAQIKRHIEVAARLGVEFRTILESANGDPCHPLVRRKVHPVPVPWSPS